jgi:putative ABC transport system permease protein
LLLRTKGDPYELIPLVQKIVSSADPGVPATRVGTFNDFLVQRFEARHFGVLLMTLFSSAALLLSAVGLYGVLACFVNRRKREIGIRIAVGAQSANILQWVLQQELKIVAIGLAGGFCVTLICSRFIEGFLYGVSANDPLSLLGGAGVLLLVALIVCLLPAFRAIRVNPIEVLRE